MNKITLWQGFTALCLSVMTAQALATIPTAERAALDALYTSTNGDQWKDNTGWGGAFGTECSWTGVTCDNGDNHIIKLYLYDNQLTGTIPVELGQLSQLESLFLPRNQLTGTIPVELGQLSQLDSLNLGSNQLIGTIPVELGQLSQLYFLFANGNQLTGTIPVELGQLSQLDSLNLVNNCLSTGNQELITFLNSIEYSNWKDQRTDCVTSPSYSLSITKTTDGAENNSGFPTDAVFTITVTPSNTSGSAITGNINYSGTASNGSDYAKAPDSFSILHGSSSTAISLDITEDQIVEGPETIIAILSTLSKGSLATSHATANLTDDDSNTTTNSDTDGVNTAEEDAAPNTGDGNNDGVKDSAQSLVSSLEAALDSQYFTIDAKGSSCSELSNVSTVTESETGNDEGLSYEAGLINFTLHGCAVGKNAVITAYFHGLVNPPTTVRKYGETPSSNGNAIWYTMPGATITPIIIDNKTVYKVVYTIVDGGLGDDDLVENGTIIDPIGLAYAPGTGVNGPSTGTQPIPTLSEWTQYVLVLLIAGIGITSGRQRKRL